MIGLGLGLTLSAARAQIFDPASLFAGGERGVWLDPSDLTTMFQDTAGTTPVTAPAQTVGRILDKSGNGFHATQSIAANRPTYGVVPSRGRVNLLTMAERFDDAAWSKVNLLPFGSGSVADATIAPDGTTTADLVVPNTTSGGHRIQQTVTIPATGTFSICAKAAGYNWILLQVANASNGCGYWFNVSSGVVGSASAYGTGFAASSPSITPLEDGFFRCTFNYTSNGTGDRALVSITTADNVSSYVGNGTSGSYLWGAQLELGSTATAYQRVVSQFDVTDPAGFPSYPLHYLYFGGDLDPRWLQTATITPNADKVQVFAGVRKLSDAAAGAVVEFSASATANLGSAGIFAPFATSGVEAQRITFASRGSTGVTPASPIDPIAAPVTAVVSGLGDISGDTSTLRVNGTQVAQNTADQGTGNYLAYPLFIGRRAGTSIAFNGQLFGLIVRFSTANLDASVISQTERWMAQKTGVTL